MSKTNYSKGSSDFYKTSKTSFSLEKVLQCFSFWFPKARDYGYVASDLYRMEGSILVLLIPIPIVEDGDYKLWLFTFSRVGRVTPKLRDMLVLEIWEIFSLGRFLNLIHFQHHYIISDIVRGKIRPKISRRRSVYVIKSEHAWKVYDIVARSIEGFVKSFRQNVRYGEDLLELCNEMERFAEIMRSEAERLKSELEGNTSTTQPSPTHHPDEPEKVREEVRSHLNLLSEAEVIR